MAPVVLEKCSLFTHLIFCSSLFFMLQTDHQSVVAIKTVLHSEGAAAAALHHSAASVDARLPSGFPMVQIKV